MTIESSRMQVPTASPTSVMQVQYELQKGLNETQSPNKVGTANKEILAATNVPQPQNQQQLVAGQISEGYLDIEV